MEKLTRTQVSLLVSYSSPFVFITALGLNLTIFNLGITGGTAKLLVLSLAFPIGFLFGRLLYFKRSHVEIQYDDETFQVFKGRRKVTEGRWRSYRTASIILDQFRRPDLRLYISLDGEHVDLPISRTNARPQQFRDHVQKALLSKKGLSPSLPVVEAS